MSLKQISLPRWLRRPHIALADVSRFGYLRTIGFAVLLSLAVVMLAAALARSTVKLQAALTADEPDLAMYVLLKDENIGATTLLRENTVEGTYDYLAQAPDGPMLVRMKKMDGEWRVVLKEKMRP